MIKTFQCKHTAAVFAGTISRKWPEDINRLALRKLLMLDAAVNVFDLQSPPGNRLEKLSGKDKDKWSVRINNQWRIRFRFADGNAYDVEITDYH